MHQINTLSILVFHDTQKFELLHDWISLLNHSSAYGEVICC